MSRARVVSLKKSSHLNGTANLSGKASLLETHVDSGLGVVRMLYARMQIDPKWSLVTERGFTWWPHHYAQRIWADEPFESDGLLITRVHAQTDFLKYPTRSEEVENHLATGMVFASLSGLVVSRDSERIRLQCSALVHEENANWMEILFGFAAAIQCCDAEFKAEEMGEALGLEPDRSDHPDSGPRPLMDDMLNIVEKAIIPIGNEPFRQATMRDFEMTAAELEKRGIIPNNIADGLIIAFVPVEIFASTYARAILQISVEKHPALGTGLLFLLRLPVELFLQRGITVDGRLILDLNTREAEENTMCHSIGSWSLDLLNNERRASYVSFVPAVGCHPNVLMNMALSTAAHAKLFINLLQDQASGR